jgi:ubiquinone/menaquinone biosynthesis C-methylase UbiE
MKKDTMPQVAKYWNDIAQDFDAIYSGKKSAFARFLDQWLRKDIYQRFDWVMEQAGDIKGKTVCDIGCGSGRFVTELARRGASRVLGIDVAPEMLKLARQMVTEAGVAGRCEFVNTDVLNWKPEEQFNLVIAIGFWDYIADPTERLRIIRRMTREDGKFLSAWPRYWTWRTPVRKVRLGVLGCPVYFFPWPQVKQLLESAGFRIVSRKIAGALFLVEARPV